MAFMTRTATLGVVMLMGYGLSAPPAQANYIVALTEQSGNVVANGSGTFDLADLSFLGVVSSAGALIQPNIGEIAIGQTGGLDYLRYLGITSEPLYFGPGLGGDASSGSGLLELGRSLSRRWIPLPLTVGELTSVLVFTSLASTLFLL